MLVYGSLPLEGHTRDRQVSEAADSSFCPSLKRSRSVERWYFCDEWMPLELPHILRQEGMECIAPFEVESIDARKRPTLVVFYSPWNKECIRKSDDMLRIGKELKELHLSASKTLRIVFVNVESADSDLGTIEACNRFIRDHHLRGCFLPSVELHRGTERFVYEGAISSVVELKEWVIDNCAADKLEVRSSVLSLAFSSD
ncbi:hypothetical protein FOL47_007873 [Perkinsus chesapeaki]|uniref:Thioredoxin domain-containing protein n=1 Tax=Perkinsus chesapeaki TaxID=330153 RepID=A0A7J6LHE2_PERCH|nr:hypothetical protein FOL47_007873 [Perkinsus chesapeaki]